MSSEQKEMPPSGTNFIFAREEVWVEGKDSPLIDRVTEDFRELNQNGSCPNLPGVSPDSILQVAVGPNHIGILLKNGKVMRVGYEYSKTKETVTEKESTPAGAAPTDSSSLPPPSAAHQPNRNNNAKFRRVMMSSFGSGLRNYYRLRTGGDARSVIIDSRRTAASTIQVPEDLINQAQVVLQGRSRDVIVRELQRTNLNVNEAVNNLLSRDDDDDGDDLGGEVMLPEELLQLLDPHHSASGAHGGSTVGSVPAITTNPPGTNATAAAASAPGSGTVANNNDDFTEALDFSATRDPTAASGNSKSQKGKNRKKKDIEISKNVLKIGENVQHWIMEEGSLVETGFVQIAATSWNLFALTAAGTLFKWQWDKAIGETKQYQRSVLENLSIENLATSNIRVAAVARNGQVVSFLDETAVGRRVSEALQFSGTIPAEKVEDVEELVVSDYLVALKCGNSFCWAGLIPLADRSKIFEAETSKQKKKHVSFEDGNGGGSDSQSQEIYEGSRVQLKAQPLYPAGSVGIFIDATKPMIGVLQKNSWKVNEKCPFRLIKPEEFDVEMTVKQEIVEEEFDRKVHPESRKRRAATPLGSSKFLNMHKAEEATWGVDEVIWIHEHRKKDVATVSKSDGPYVVIDYASDSLDRTYASIHSDCVQGDLRHDVTLVQRIVRRDEVRLVNSRAAKNRTPKVKQNEFKTIEFDHSKKVLSIVCDPNGFRLLIKAGNHLYLSRVLITGKTVSTRRLPLFAPAILGRGQVSLLSFGDARTIYVRDGIGSIYPLQRDAINGFREPLTVVGCAGQLVATLAKPIEEVTRISTNGSFWEGMFLCVPNSITPSHSKHLCGVTSLAQLVLYADVDGVRRFLDLMNDIRAMSMIKSHEYRQLLEEELMFQPIDCASNVLHVAIRQSLPVSNSQNVDVDPKGAAKTPTKDDRWTSSFSQVPLDGEEGDHEPKRWETILRGRTQKADTPIKGKPGDKGLKFSTIKKKDGDEEQKEKRSPRAKSRMRIRPEDFPVGVAVSNPQTRQRNSLAIVDLLVSHPAICKGPIRPRSSRSKTSTSTTSTAEPMEEDGVLDMYEDMDTRTKKEPEIESTSTIRSLLSCRDSSGMTPFMLAVNLRAYGAAISIWNIIKKLRRKRESINMRHVFPTSDGHFNPDDSPLFVLCYNDPCSFTWTGEDHINQDIYECRTCGLTGSLCCCSECALTCHRNHDCKQKKTAPTAYCDCWEKCTCKALIEGDEAKREFLLLELLKHTRLYEMLNGRKEHVVLFLAKTVARQTREQSSAEKLKKRRHADHRDHSSVPEHNLEPPKFARFSLTKCLEQYSVLKSAIMVGWTDTPRDQQLTQDEYVAKMQNGATHMDKLIFTLLGKGMMDYLNTATNTLSTNDTFVYKKRDPLFEEVMTRFVRSMVRIIALTANLSPQVVCMVATQKINDSHGFVHLRDESRVRILNAMGFSSILPVFKREPKTDKLMGTAEMITRALKTMRRMSAYAALEFCAAADAILSPLTLGVVGKLSNPVVTGSHDPMEILEKYFASEKSLSELLDLKKMELHDWVRMKKKPRTDGDQDESQGRDSGDEGGSGEDGISESAENVSVSARHRGDSTGGGGTAGTARRRPRPEEDPEGRPSDESSTSSSEDDDDLEEDDDARDGIGNFRFLEGEDYEMEEEEGDGENDDWGMESSSSEGDGDEEDEDRQEEEEEEQDEPEQEDEQEQQEEGEQGTEPVAEVAAEPVASGDAAPVPAALRRRVFDSFDDDDGDNENREPPPDRSAVEEALDAAEAVEQQRVDGQLIDDFLNRQHSIAARFGRGEGIPADLTSSGHSTRNMNPAELPSRNGTASNNTTSGTTARIQVVTRTGRRFTTSARSTTATTSASEASTDDGNTRTSTTAPSVSASLSTTTAKKSPVPTPDPNNLPSKNQAEQQLAMTFSILVRFACDIILNKLVEDSTTADEKKMFDGIVGMCDNLLSQSFIWMERILDNTEAKLRFIAGRKPTKGAAEKEKEPTIKKEKDDSPVSAAANRKSTLSYITGLLRSVRNENGDAKVHIDDEILPAMSLVLDAYMVYSTARSHPFEEWKIRLDQFSNSLSRGTEKRQSVDKDVMKHFFQRGNDQFHPRHWITGEWDMTREGSVKYHVPLIEKPSLLRTDANQQDYYQFMGAAVTMNQADHAKQLDWQNVPSERRASMALTHHSNNIIAALRTYNHFPPAEGYLAIEPKRQQEEAHLCPAGFQPFTLTDLREGVKKIAGSEDKKMKMRWERTIEYMADMTYSTMSTYFGDCVPLTYSPLLATVARFNIRHELFTRTLEKFRVTHGITKEIPLDVERDSSKMILETIRQLNTTYARRVCSIPVNQLEGTTPMACAKLRVRFHNEPGEGTGVTRSFFTAFAEACASKKSPFAGISETSSNTIEMSSMLPNDPESKQKKARVVKEKLNEMINWVNKDKRSIIIDLLADPYDPVAERDAAEAATAQGTCDSVVQKLYALMPTTLPLYKKLLSICDNKKDLANRIMGVMVNFPIKVFAECSENEDTLRLYVADIKNRLILAGELAGLEEETNTMQLLDSKSSATSSSAFSMKKYLVASVLDEDEEEDEDLESMAQQQHGVAQEVVISSGSTLRADAEPLFIRASPKGFYTPVIGNGSQLRVTAFRNVGRIMGICLSHGDIFPLHISRHVFKYILRQPVQWVDLAFYDLELFDSLKAMLTGGSDMSSFEMTFAMSSKVGETSRIFDLKPGGNEIDVTEDNVVEYVYRYAESIMLGKNTIALEAIRDGVLDVIPEAILAGLNAEDLRLMLCGVEEVSIPVLKANTVFLDESRAPAATLSKFKAMFWQVVEALTAEEKQELIFFWTGAPSLPSSGDWQNNATVMLRPADDQYLPTANTCISRLYVPVYTSKKILKNKLLMAIKNKTFGFV